MLIPLLLLTSPLTAHTPSAAGTAVTRKDPPVHVWFNEDGRYVYGDKAKVYVRTAEDGYLLVLRADARGGVKVLSPVDPGDDQQIRGGKKYEARGRGGREAFVVDDTTGNGVVLAAWSKTPFDVSRYEHDGHWDFQALDGAAGGRSISADHPETRLLSVLDAIKGGGRNYEYDAATYVVYSPRMARALYSYPYPYPYAWSGGWWGYDPWWDGPFWGSRVVIVPRRFGFRPAFGERRDRL